MTDRSLYTYAMAKSLYDKQEKDILDILVPFIVITVNKEKVEEGETPELYGVLRFNEQNGGILIEFILPRIG